MSPSRIRRTAAERHEQVIEAAVQAFAANGYGATTTDQVARLVGVSQPYVIRLFGTKQTLFITAFEHVCDRIEALFRTAVDEERAAWPDAPPHARIAALGRIGHEKVLADKDLMLVMLHGFAAAADPRIGAVVRRRYGGIYELVRKLTDADPAEARDFMATGALLNILAVMRVLEPEHNQQWSSEIMGSFGQADEN